MYRRYPNYPDEADYQTNSPSYYEDLARKQKMIELLSKKIWEYEETLDLTLEDIEARVQERFTEWDERIESFPDNVESLLQEWLSDGTLDHIINDTIFNWKVDQTEFDALKEKIIWIDAVKDFGVKNDGTDTYAELKDLADSVKGKKGVFIYFKSGHYKIDQYVIFGGTNKNEIRDIRFEDIEDLTISGYGATFDVKGNFHRSADYTSGSNNQNRYSYSKSVIPFRIQRCNNVVLKGFNLFGNVDKMTKDPELWENESHGIAIYGSENVTLESIKSDYFPTDGICISEDKGTFYDNLSGSPKISKNIYAKNVYCEHNGRQGISITQGKDMLFELCKFNHTGFTGGHYGHHAPSAGVDIEPDFFKTSSSSVVEDNTKNITFINCEFKGNLGAQIMGHGGSFAHNIKFINPTVKTAPESSKEVIKMPFRSGIIEGGTVHITNGGYIRPENYGNHTYTVLKDMEVYSNGQAIVSLAKDSNHCAINIHNCRFVGTHEFPLSEPFINIDNARAVFKDNYVFIPDEMHPTRGTGFEACKIYRALNVKDNMYETDLVPVGSNNSYLVGYTGTRRVQNEDYYPLHTKLFKPKESPNRVVGLPFSKGITDVGDKLVITNKDDPTKYHTIDWGDGPPTNEKWETGSIRFATDTKNIASRTIGWKCIVGGVPGAWQPIERGEFLRTIENTPAYEGQEALVDGLWYKANGVSSPDDWKRITN